jgi:hypothetical protein
MKNKNSATNENDLPLHLDPHHTASHQWVYLGWEEESKILLDESYLDKQRNRKSKDVLLPRQ